MTSLPKTYPCPHCKKPADLTESNAFRPFCSDRCKLIDLGHWASESYRNEGESKPNADEDDSSTPTGVKHMKLIFKMSLIGLCAIATSTAYAGNAPTQNMIDVCADKESGDVCEYVVENGDTLDGTCVMNSDQKNTVLPKL